MHRLPWWALLLGLLRPDGVIIGATYALLGLASQWQGAHCKRYVLHSLAAASVGAAYFLWRLEYFDQLLPLPLYVKSSSNEVFAGINSNLTWLLFNFALVLVAVAGAWRRKVERTRAILAIVPLLALLLSLSFAHQTQNVAFRFQAPVTAVLVLISGLTIGRWVQGGRRWSRIPIMLSGSVLVGAWYGFAFFGTVQTLRNAEYINFLPYRLTHEVDETTSIALTEAGRMAYWVGGRKYDLIGLNTAYPAVNGLDVEYLKRIEPDIFFVHTVHSLSEWPQQEAGFFEVSLADIRRRLVVDPNWKALRDPVDRAPLVVYDFLAQSGDAYDLVMVRYFDCYCHLYAIKKGGRIAYDRFLVALEDSFQPQARLSYRDMKKRRESH
jgi:hypothetical protein